MSLLKGLVLAFEMPADEVVPALTHLVKERGYSKPTKEERRIKKALQLVSDGFVQIEKTSDTRIMVAVNYPNGFTDSHEDRFTYALPIDVFDDLRAAGIV